MFEVSDSILITSQRRQHMRKGSVISKISIEIETPPKIPLNDCPTLTKLLLGTVVWTGKL